MRSSGRRELRARIEGELRELTEAPQRLDGCERVPRILDSAVPQSDRLPQDV
jgi:hypothetical protein